MEKKAKAPADKAAEKKKSAASAGKSTTKKAPAQKAAAPEVRKVAPFARPRPRHYGFMISFGILVLLPFLLSVFYLFFIAADQYKSRVSFSVRSEEMQNPLDALGSLGQISTGTSSDAGILNEYIRSQKLLEDIAPLVDLEAAYSRPAFDPVFSFAPDQPIEDLLHYWNWMTHVSFDTGSGLIDIEAYAFDPESAHQIATAIMQASSVLVEELSDIAREDTTRFALLELDLARERLATSRVALGELRAREQIIDPAIDLESRMGVVTALEQQLAAELIEYDLLIRSTRQGDSRRENSERTIAAIEERIAEERNKIGHGTEPEGGALASVVGEYEALLADRIFAEQAYVAAAANYDTALAEARRKSRYLAAHIPPTMAQSSEAPARLLMSLSVLGACLLFWMIGTLSVYALLDRR